MRPVNSTAGTHCHTPFAATGAVFRSSATWNTKMMTKKSFRKSMGGSFGRSTVVQEKQICIPHDYSGKSRMLSLSRRKTVQCNQPAARWLADPPQGMVPCWAGGVSLNEREAMVLIPRRTSIPTTRLLKKEMAGQNGVALAFKSRHQTET